MLRERNPTTRPMLGMLVFPNLGGRSTPMVVALVVSDGASVSCYRLSIQTRRDGKNHDFFEKKIGKKYKKIEKIMIFFDIYPI